jgi:hypothetical protein
MPYVDLAYIPDDAFLVLYDWGQTGNANTEATLLLGQLALQPQSNAWLYDALSNIDAPRGVFP